MRKYIVILLFALLQGCTKTEAGPRGENGDPGPMGSASITKTYVVATTQWTQADKAWEYTLYIPEITPDVVEKGSVNVLMGGGSQYNTLPLLAGDNITQFSFSQGVVKLKNLDLHGALPDTRPATQNVRVVILSGI